MASYADTIVSIAKAVAQGSDTTLIGSLRKQSPLLLKLATDFADISEDFEIFCFYELLPWRFSTVVGMKPANERRHVNQAGADSNKVVDQSSAVIQGRMSDGLTTTHSGLAKYLNDADPNFVKVGKRVSSMVTAAKRLACRQETIPKGDLKPSSNKPLRGFSAYSRGRSLSVSGSRVSTGS